VLLWYDSIVVGNIALCITYGMAARTLWLELLAAVGPPAPATPDAVDPKPPFDPRRTAFGPAAHTAFCSMPRYMEYVRDTTGASEGFFKRAATIWLEHLQKTLPLQYARFEIGAKARKIRARELLSRASERCVSRLLINGPPSEQPTRKQHRNRAYEGVDLSRTIDDAIYLAADPAILAAVRAAAEG
jgi:hypothetical protein